MRVHGDKVIKRRPQIKRKSNYHDYLPDLQEDFYHMCGYCGKTEDVTRNAFEIDHFVPQKYDESRKNDYNNLVYSCYVCNRKKASNWPSKNAGVQFLSIPIEISILFGNSEHPFPERKNMPFRSRVQLFI